MAHAVQSSVEVMSRKNFPWFFLPLWLVIMVAIAAAGLYLGYKRPDVALALVFMFLIAAWLFWWSWHDLVKH